MPIVALLIGFVIACQGVLGLVAPDLFVGLVSSMQVPPMIYVAAVIRVIIGIVFIRVAPRSRAYLALRILGFVIVAGGVLTPFVGAQFADVILGWWSAGGPAVVRVWALASMAIGAFVVYAVSPRTSAA